MVTNKTLSISPSIAANIPINPDSMWYSQIKEGVHIQQNRKIWVSEAKVGCRPLIPFPFR